MVPGKATAAVGITTDVFLFSCFTLNAARFHCRQSLALSGSTLTAVVFVLYFNPPVFFVFLRAHDKTKQKKQT